MGIDRLTVAGEFSGINLPQSEFEFRPLTVFIGAGAQEILRVHYVLNNARDMQQYSDADISELFSLPTGSAISEYHLDSDEDVRGIYLPAERIAAPHSVIMHMHAQHMQRIHSQALTRCGWPHHTHTMHELQPVYPVMPEGWTWRGRPLHEAPQNIRQAASFMAACSVLHAGFSPTHRLYIEYPCLGLAPQTHVAVIQDILRVISSGHYVAIALNSLSGLYALNNALLRNDIDPQCVSAYGFGERGVKNILDRKAPFIDELPLGHANDRMMTEFHLILVQRRNHQTEE